MSRKRCAVLSCSITGKENVGISFHRFPSDQNICSQWVNLTHNNIIINSFEQKGLASIKYKVICSIHFKNEDYSIGNDVGNRMLLYKGAIPSLNLPTSVYNKTVLDKQDTSSIWRPNVLSPLLKKMLNNTNLDGRPFSQQPKVLSPKVNKMLCNIYENFDKSLQQPGDTSSSFIFTSSISSITDSENNIIYDEDLGVSDLVDENTPHGKLVQHSNVKDKTSKSSTIKYF